MIATYREDLLEQDELYDDFNLYGLPMRPIIHRGVARPYRPKKRRKRKNRAIRGIARPYTRPKKQTRGKAPLQILLPRHKAIQFGKPRQSPFKKSTLTKIAVKPKAPSSHKNKVTPSQRASVRRTNRLKAKVKALKKEIIEKETVPPKPESKMSSKKKILIVALVITTTTIVGYVIWKGQKKETL
jgi:hypothetical protein